MTGIEVGSYSCCTDSFHQSNSTWILLAAILMVWIPNKCASVGHLSILIHLSIVYTVKNTWGSKLVSQRSPSYNQLPFVQNTDNLVAKLVPSLSSDSLLNSLPTSDIKVVMKEKHQFQRWILKIQCQKGHHPCLSRLHDHSVCVLCACVHLWCVRAFACVCARVIP